nr:multicopper oxidase family protein [Deltaproteobacteria bacterium]
TIHWHGLRVANSSDGTSASQIPVQPNESFDYDLEIIDSGLFWYHPHMHGDVQIEAGLYAPFLVHGPADAAIEVSADRVFVLDDVKLESSGKLSTRTDTLDLMLGRQGNVIMVNGREKAAFSAAVGNGRERWRFVNSANGRYFNLELGRPFFVIGWDGGLVNAPYETDRLLIAPGERYEVLVDLDGEDGEKLVLRTVHYDRGHNIPDPGPIELFTVTLRPAAPAAPLPTTWGQTAPIAFDATTPRRRFVLEEDDSVPASPVFTINTEAFPNVTPLNVRAGNVEVWEIENLAEMDHPFHLHGMFFQVLDANEQPIAPLALKDTVNVPQETTLKFAVRYGEPGRWMFHCHILEHAERGMMGELAVAP